ncbi:hypothetical protein ACN268_00250 [Micromonospora sp. WMMD735]|uniref:hypothetical protein n=1 Tax=Micromonospora sp. WMMD735 TaxID=3404130 RepID=UPI003B937636
MAMNAVVGCTASEGWADQRAKRRTVVLVIVMVFFTWLTGVEHLNVLEAAGLVAVIGIAAGMVIDRVVDGNRSSGEDLATLLRLVDGPGRA